MAAWLVLRWVHCYEPWPHGWLFFVIVIDCNYHSKIKVSKIQAFIIYIILAEAFQSSCEQDPRSSRGEEWLQGILSKIGGIFCFLGFRGPGRSSFCIFCSEGRGGSQVRLFPGPWHCPKSPSARLQTESEFCREREGMGWESQRVFLRLFSFRE